VLDTNTPWRIFPAVRSLLTVAAEALLIDRHAKRDNQPIHGE
jgi:hypothetical protein